MMKYTINVQIIIMNIIGISFVWSFILFSVFKTARKKPNVVKTAPIFMMLEMGMHRKKIPIDSNNIAMILC
jgi:hypothetical protein